MRALSCFILILLAFSFQAEAQYGKAFIRSGNVYFTQDNDQTIQLTSSGQAHSPVLSPDKKSIAFISVGTEMIPELCRNFADTHSTYGNQIWIIDIEHKKERLLVKNNFACNKPMEMIIAPRHLTFSPDSKTLYFLTRAWTTSSALHVVNISDTKEHYLLPANSLAVVKYGEYKGDLILNQHRYFIGGGSYDWYWLFTPEGKEIGPLGEEPSIIR
jgi:WD40-like Beta Propeller Repeat